MTRLDDREIRSNAESIRLAQDAARTHNWKRWGPYLADRQWGTVREDYSADGSCWTYFPHEHARSRAYRWGEDGLLGITDRECRLCFATALWNGNDPILKERLFGLTNPEGNHGEDVKEQYFHLESTPTHSYMKALYRYPQAAFPYQRLIDENARRSKDEPEYELLDTGVFDAPANRFFDVFIEYAKAGPDDLLIQYTIVNRGAGAADIHLLPTLWFRNTWSWGRQGEGHHERPRITRRDAAALHASHETLGEFLLTVGAARGSAIDGVSPEFLFTENETNHLRLYGTPGEHAHTKDAFHDCVVGGRREAVSPHTIGTKAAAWFRLRLDGGAEQVIRLRLTARHASAPDPLGASFDEVFEARRRECDDYYRHVIPDALGEEERLVARRAYAGLLWTKQFYHYVVKDWLDGDPSQPPPPEARRSGRNADWPHLFNRDVISMPDKWEYPWYAAWDLAFHMIPFARLDPQFAKDQLLLFLREWYMHPSGQIPAYEFALSDVNPPVHAWACWRVYKMTGRRGKRDRAFLARAFQKLLINFTWWVNRKDIGGKHIFAGGFLGLDNIGVFDRSKPLPLGADGRPGHLEQADGTAWMAFYCGTMLAIALELAGEDPAYEDVASKFFEHFVAIADAMNTLGGNGLWDEDDGFYYDQLHIGARVTPLKVRSLVGLIPLIAVEIVDHALLDRLPGFRKRTQWFVENRPDLSRHISWMVERRGNLDHAHLLLAIPSQDRLERVLRYMLDESEFLSPHGLRSVSRRHAQHPYVLRMNGDEFRVDYTPGESNTGLFGGNSNWRGPIWYPVNFLIIEALERYHYFHGDSFQVECPTGSGEFMTLDRVAAELRRRLASIFLPDPSLGGRRPCHGDDARFSSDPLWRDHILFYEYFHGDTGRGIGANHQTGWTALVATCLEGLVRRTGTSRVPASATRS